ncbi:MAG TPA: hypothetical protein PKA83_09615 [Pirellulaceae bacterium]|nr:hypothetical protein [Pirellulaceae bacterium]
MASLPLENDNEDSGRGSSVAGALLARDGLGDLPKSLIRVIQNAKDGETPVGMSSFAFDMWGVTVNLCTQLNFGW